MKLKLVTGVIALCMAAAGVLIGALPASAYDGSCDAGDYCIWENAYFDFGFYDTPGVLADYTKAKGSPRGNVSLPGRVRAGPPS